MKFVHEENEILLYNNEEKICAGVKFPTVKDGIVNVTSTYVNKEMEGQGIAGKLMMELVSNMKNTNRKAITTCTYARNWFSRHPEYQDIIIK